MACEIDRSYLDDGRSGARDRSEVCDVVGESQRTIYIIDDDAAVRESLRAFFESYGFAVRDFSSGAAFMAQPIDTFRGCLILDLHLPIVSGLELLAKIRADGRCKLPIVVFTGRGDPMTGRRLLEAGAKLYLEKPIDSDALLAAMTGLMQ